jgi:hypothetical protein
MVITQLALKRVTIHIFLYKQNSERIFTPHPEEWTTFKSAISVSSSSRKAALKAVRTHTVLEHVAVPRDDLRRKFDPHLRLSPMLLSYFSTLAIEVPFFPDWVTCPATIRVYHPEYDFDKMGFGKVKLHMAMPLAPIGQRVWSKIEIIMSCEAEQEWSDNTVEALVNHWTLMASRETRAFQTTAGRFTIPLRVAGGVQAMRALIEKRSEIGSNGGLMEHQGGTQKA